MPAMYHDQAELGRLGLTVRSGVVVVVDLVSSVRRIEDDEFGTIARWVGFVGDVKRTLLPQFSGRLIKSLGDGLLIEFADASTAVEASLAIMKRAEGVDYDLALRIGVDAGQFFSDEHDVYGKTVNRAARLMVRGDPGQIVVSEEVRQAIPAAAGLRFDDLGLRYLRYMYRPVRAFAVQIDGATSARHTPAHLAMAPTLAIVPFRAERPTPALDGLGDILCEELISSMVHSHYLNVIARQSTSVFKNDAHAILHARQALSADFVLRGTFSADRGGLILSVMLIETASDECISQSRYAIPLEGEFAHYREALEEMRMMVSCAIHGRVLEASRHLPLNAMASHALLALAIDYMHQFERGNFEAAGRMLDVLQEKEPGHNAPFAWKAHWHHLKIQQGWSHDIAADMQAAREACKRALDRNPESSLALAVGALMSVVVDRRSDLGAHYSAHAIALTPSDPRAWLYHGAVQIFSDEGSGAVQAVLRAQYLSPLDPYRSVFDSIAASAYFVARDYENANRFAERAYRQNNHHASTLRIRAAALHRLGREAEARMAAAEMMQRDPTLTITNWKKRSPAAECNSGRDLCDAFAALGVPA